MSQATLDPQTEARLRRRRIIISVIVASIAVHFIGAIIAGIWIVARFILATPTTFEVKKEIRIAAEEREHRMNMAEFDAARPKPSFTDKMSTARPTEFSLPDLPTLPIDAMTTVDPSDIVSDQLSSLAGTGAGSGTGGGGGGKGSAVSFFGISDMATRVAIVVDVSDSMFDRQPGKFDVVKDEASKLVLGLGINTLFNIIIFEGGSVAMFPEMQPATDANKAKASAWIQSVVGGKGHRNMSINGGYGRMGTVLSEGGGTRLDTALKQALGMRPSTVFVISDGQIAKNPIRDKDDSDSGKRGNQVEISQEELLDIVKEAQAKLQMPARIHSIYFVTGKAKNEEENKLRSLARGNDGRFKKVEAERLKAEGQ